MCFINNILYLFNVCDISYVLEDTDGGEVHFLLLIMIICVPSKMLFIYLLFFVSE